MVKKPPELYLVPASVSGERKVLQFPVRSHEGAPRASAWPQPSEWRDRVQQLTRNPVKPDER